MGMPVLVEQLLIGGGQGSGAIHVVTMAHGEGGIGHPDQATAESKKKSHSLHALDQCTRLGLLLLYRVLLHQGNAR
jgi:hypothetical protein